MNKTEVAIAAVILGLLAFGIWSLVNQWYVGLDYQKTVGVYFEYADRASSPELKLKNFNLYIDALRKEGLTQGCNAITFCEQPNAQMDKNFEVALSLQKRLEDLTHMDANSMQYQQGIHEISTTEMCWFPVAPFHQYYMLKHGAWGAALTPVGIENRCAPPPRD